MYFNKESKFILVRDEHSLTGLKIFKTLLKLYHKDSVPINILSFDDTVNNILSNLNIDATDLNVISDGVNYNNHSTNLSLSILEGSTALKGILAIYSLSSMIISNNIDKTCSALLKLSQANPDLRIIALIHSKVHSFVENEKIDRLAMTILHVDVPIEINHVAPKMPALFEGVKHSVLITERFSSGKVSVHTAECEVKGFEFLSFKKITDSKPQKLVAKPDPTANLTFNLKLKAAEIDAKNKLQLPYMKQHEEMLLAEDDFYDDEDPDDDLDI